MAILENANDVTLTRTSNTRRAVSNSGYARIERAGPTFYGLEVSLPILETNNYRAVNNELIDLEDGIQFLESSLPSQYRITNLQGPVSTQYAAVNGSTPGINSITNNTEIVLNNVASGTKLLKGDYIQFVRLNSNNINTTTKVYQIIEDTTALSTNLMTIKLNTGLIINPQISSAEVLKVEDVLFDYGTNRGLGVFEIRDEDNNGNNTDINTSTTHATPTEITNELNARSDISATLIGTVGGVSTIRITFSSSLGNGTIRYVPTAGVNDSATYIIQTSYAAAKLSDTIRVGNDVQFKFMISESPQVTIIPQNANNNLYSYSTINLQEIL